MEPTLLIEMATVCRVGPYKIQVHTEPQRNPSFHVCKGKDAYEIVIQIKDLTILEVKFNHTFLDLRKGSLPPNIELKEIRKILSAPFEEIPTVTNGKMVEVAWWQLNEG